MRSRLRRAVAVVALTLRTGVAVADPVEPPSEPPDVGGCWDIVIDLHFPMPNLRGQLSFVVDDASLRGTVTLHGEAQPVRDGTTGGDEIRFDVDLAGTPSHFEGRRVSSNLIGTVVRSGSQLSWTATPCSPRSDDSAPGKDGQDEVRAH
jgi:hypothetical protein